MKPRNLSLTSSFFTLVMTLGGPMALADTYYWDTNSTAAGSGPATGSWGIDSFWSASSAGTSATTNSTLTSADDAVFSAGINGTAGTVTVVGSQTASSLTFGNDVSLTLSGGTSITLGGTGGSSGIFVVPGNNAANTINTGLILAADSSIQNEGAGILTIAGGITGSQNLILNNQSSTAGGITLSGGVVDFSGSLTNSGTGTGSTVISANIGSSVVELIQSSATSQLTLSGTNTYSGFTTIQAGTLALVAGGSLADSSDLHLVGSGAVFSISGITAAGETVGMLEGVDGTSIVLGSKSLTIGGNGFTSQFGGVISGGGGSLTKTGNYTQILSGANTYSGATTIQDGTLELVGNGSLANNSAVNLTGGNAVFSVAGIAAPSETVGTLAGVGGSSILLGDRNLTTNMANGVSLFDGVISGDGSLTKVGGPGGNLVLRGANSYSGATTIQAGILTLSAGGSLSDISAVSLTGSSARLNIAGIFAAGETVGSLAGIGGSLVILGAKNLTIGADDSSTLFAGALTGTGGSLTKVGIGTQSLGGINTYTGATTVQEGSLALVDAGTLADTTAVILASSSAEFSIAGISAASEAIGSLEGVGGSSVVLGGKNLTIGGNNTSTLFNGVISGGSGSLTKIGTGTQILGGSNGYNGATTIQSGTLQFSYPASLYGGIDTLWTKENIIVNSGATLALNVGAVGEFTSGNVTTLLGNLTSGVDNNGLTGGSNIGFDTSNAAGGSFTIAAAIGDSTGTGAGSLGVTKLGANTLVLSGANSYSGETKVLAGTLKFTNQGSLYNGTDTSWTKENISVSSSASLALNVGGVGEFTAGNVTTLLNNLTSGIDNNGLAGGSTVGFDTTNAAGGSFTIADSIADSTGTGAGTLGVDKLGTNTLVLTGNNTYTGTTSIRSGTLELSGTGALSDTTAVTLGSASSVFSISGIAAAGEAIGSLSGVAGSSVILGGKTLSTGTNGGSTSFAGVLSGVGGGLTKTGAGTQTLTGANSYTGATAIDAGSLVLSGGGSLSGDTTLQLNGATAVFDISGISGAGQTVASVSGVGGTAIILGNRSLTAGANDASTTFSGTLSGESGSLVKVGGGILTLEGTNTYTGRTTVSSGSLALTGSGSLADTSAVNLNGSSAAFSISGISSAGETVGSLAGLAGSSVDLGAKTLTVGADNANAYFRGTLSGTDGSLTKIGTGTQFLNGANTNTGTTTVTSGTLALAEGGSLADASAVILNGPGAALDLRGKFAVGETVGSITGVAGSTIHLGPKNLTVSGDASTTFAGTLSGYYTTSSGNYNGGSLTKGGTGTLTLSGANTYSGATTVSDGALVISGSGSLSNSSRIVLSGAASVFDISGISASGETVGSLSGVAGSSVILGGKNLTLGDYQNSSSTFAGNLSGTGGSLTKADSYSIQILSGTNTYTGATTVNSGTLQFARQASLYNNIATSWTKENIIVKSGSTLAFNVGGSDEFTTSDVATLLGNLTVGINNNGLRAGAHVGFDTSNALGGSFTIATAIVDSTGVGSGSLGLTKLGTNTLILSGANTYTGTTEISGGSLVLTGPAALSDTAYVYLSGSGTSLDISGISASGETIGSLYGNGSVILGAKNLTMGGANGSGSFGGMISGSGNLTKIGNGDQYLSGTNTYSGTTTVDAGTLVFSTRESLYNGSAASWTRENISVAAGATLAFGVGPGEFSTGDVTTLLGNLTTGLNNNGFKAGSNIGFSIDYYTQTITNAISDSTGTGGGSLGVTKMGSGTLVLSGANSYSGPTLVRSGTLQFANTNALYGGNSANWVKEKITVNGTLAVNVGGAGEFTSGNVSTLLTNLSANGASSGGFRYGATIGLDTSNAAGGSFNYAGVISNSASGPLGVSKMGANELVLSGANTYTGTTRIEQGSLKITNTNASGFIDIQNGTLLLTGAGDLSNTSSVRFDSGGVFDISGITAGGQTIEQIDYYYYGGSVVLGGKNLAIGAGGSNSWHNGSISGVGGSITKNGIGTFSLGGTNTYTGPTNVNGGTMQMTGSSTSPLVVSGGAILILDGNNVGSATVNSGSLRVNGTLSGNASVNSGGTLRGTGTITGSLTVNSGGKLAPGASIESLGSGTLSFAHNSTYDYEVDSSALSSAWADLQKVSGNLNLNGTVNLTLTDLAGAPGIFEPGTILSLINYTGSWNGGLFSFGGVQIADEGIFTAGLNSWRIDYNAANGGMNFATEYAGGSDSFVNLISVIIVPSAIPEPASALLGGLSAFLLLRRRRQA